MKKKEKTEKLPKEKKVIDHKKEKKQTIIGMSITITASIVVGVCIGTILKSTLGGSDSVPEIDESLYQDDIKAITKKYEKVINDENKDLTKTLTPIEMVQVSFDLLERTNYMNECYGNNIQKIFGKDSVQIVTSMKAKYNEDIYAESISSGSNANIGSRFFQSNGTIKYYNIDGDKSRFISSTRQDGAVLIKEYKDNSKTMTIDEYKETYGSKLSDSTNLIISSKTIKEGTKPLITQNDDGGYTIEVELSEVACYKYKQQIVATESRLKKVKSFDRLKLTCELDSKLYMKKYISEEEYSVEANIFSVTVPCQSTLTYTYYYDVTRDSFPSGTESYATYGRGI